MSDEIVGGSPQFPGMSARGYGGWAANPTMHEDDLREARGNALTAAVYFHGEPESQTVFREDEVEQVVTTAKRFFNYIWDGE